MPRMLWDIFCRVIDNHGDVGVCWRLAADLAARGLAVRLWIDDASALRWMAPGGDAGVEVIAWTDAVLESEPGDVVIEALGCDPPAAFVARMAARSRPPVWVNLEYLSAEPYAERSHGLPSPQQSGPGTGLVKWFFYPGFGPASGGLLREADLAARQHAFDADAWLAAQGCARHDGERIVSLFCYRNEALPALLRELGRQPTLLLATHGIPAQQIAAELGATLQHGALRAQLLPALTQSDYDHLLWSCDLNFVRGEDSFVRAQWAGSPFVWQIYPQDDGAHAAKLSAFLERHLQAADPDLRSALQHPHLAWNGLAAAATAALPAPAVMAQWADLSRRWRGELLAQPDLATRLIGFIREKR